ncbi:MAG: DUF2971 domain-containing protein [Sedimentisphaerales bacterium]
MNVLYKYCEQLGIVKILGSLELKLPNISEVNDPLECLPILYCPKDKDAIEAACIDVFKRRNIDLPVDYKEKIAKGEIHEILEKSQRELQKEWNQKSYLLSVSKTAQNTVMWAHYADKHKGAVIGIDFDNIFNVKMKIDPVDYSELRPKINILSDVTLEKFRKVLFTKSVDWSYEKEFRVIFLDDHLKGLEQHGLASFKDFNGKKTWFLRLNPESIREVVFGLYTEESLKSALKKLIERPELQHVKLYQTQESETYTLNLVEIKDL